MRSQIPVELTVYFYNSEHWLLLFLFLLTMRWGVLTLYTDWTWPEYMVDCDVVELSFAIGE